MLSKGYTQKHIADKLNVSEALVNNDVKYLSDRAQYSIKEYVNKTLPEEMQISLTRLSMLIKESWKDIDDPGSSKKDKHSAIQIVRDCTALRLEILGSGILANQLNSSKENSSSRDKKEEQDIRSETRIIPDQSITA